MRLWADFLNNDKRPIHKWKHYFPIYERHFKDFVDKPVTFLEIGCGSGGSLQMWKRYFGPHARIVGIDINPQCQRFAEDQIEIHIGPQQDLSFLQRVIDRAGIPDIVLDDGSHVMSHITTTFNFLYPRMLKNGVYLVEDLHSAYWEEYEGGLRKPATFLELCKSLIDELNADHSRGTLSPTEFTKSTMGMHFYDSVVVFERGAYTTKNAPQRGGTFELIRERIRSRMRKSYRPTVAHAPNGHASNGSRHSAAATRMPSEDRTAAAIADIQGSAVRTGTVTSVETSEIPILRYVPERRQLPTRVLNVETAWTGIESIVGDLIQRFNVGSERCLEFGVEFGYSTAALSCFFVEVVGVDRFTGDKHTVEHKDIFRQTSRRLSSFPNIRLVRCDYRDWIAKDQSSYDLIHVDIVHTYEDTLACGLWSARHSPCVLFHDTISFPDVTRAVTDIARLTGKRFYNFEESNGLGILVG